MNINPPKDDAALRVPPEPRARHVDPTYHTPPTRPVSETEERHGGSGHPPPQHRDDWLTLNGEEQKQEQEKPAELPPQPVEHIDVKA